MCKSLPIYRLTGEDVPRLPGWLFDRCPVRINERVKRGVIFLGIVDDTGAFAPYGTGFLLGHRVDSDDWFLYLVTAKHVIDDMRATNRPMVGRLNLKAGGAQIGRVTDAWETHPTDPKCDVAVAPFVASLDTFDFGIVPTTHVLTDAYVAENNVGGGDSVFTVGLLVSHFGREKNVPVVRSGNIAAMPDEKVDLGDKYGHQLVYLIESRSIGGLSGSPVYLQTPAFRVLKGMITPMTDHQTEYLLGVHIGLFETKASGDSIRSDTAERRENFLEAMSAGIGVVVPIQRAIEIIDGPGFVRQREEVMKRHKEKTAFVPSSVTPISDSVLSENGSRPSSDENPNAREDFMRLQGVAARKQKPAD